MNIGDITEKDPAQAPIMNLPTIIIAKDFTSDTPTPIRRIILIKSNEFHHPIDANLPPSRAPTAAPRGAEVPIIEFAVAISDTVVHPS